MGILHSPALCYPVLGILKTTSRNRHGELPGAARITAKEKYESRRIYRPAVAVVARRRPEEAEEHSTSIPWNSAPATIRATRIASSRCSRTKRELKEFKQKLADNGFSISALSCHGNPLHPDTQTRQERPGDQRARPSCWRRSSACRWSSISPAAPAIRDNSKWPNWVTCPWPPDYLEILKWQWEKKVTPYWTKHAKFADDHGVKVAIEMHPGFVVYSPETMLKLRDIAGKSDRLQLRPEPHVLAGHRPDRRHPRSGRLHLPRARQGHADLRAQPAA